MLASIIARASPTSIIPQASHVLLPAPRCHNMQELPTAAAARARVQDMLTLGGVLALEDEIETNPVSKHILYGLAYTIGSALGSDPPTREECRSAFTASANRSMITAGAKAWSKHAHRSSDADRVGWWGGQPTGPVASINERALILFEKVMDNATWQNLHWLPHQVLVYEVRVEEGYGMRWSQDRGRSAEVEVCEDEAVGSAPLRAPWSFRGFLEPMMENGHEVGWRH